MVGGTGSEGYREKERWLRLGEAVEGRERCKVSFRISPSNRPYFSHSNFKAIFEGLGLRILGLKIEG